MLMELKQKTHRVVGEFASSLGQLEVLYKRSFEALEVLPEELKTGNFSGHEDILRHYNTIFQIYSEMVQVHHSLHSNYYEFRSFSQTNIDVKAEFNKLPVNFPEVSSQLKNLIECNKTYLDELEQLL
jgi:hypothetical protein